ncbi:MAG: hypothetical protein QF535_10225, partial [Anaerolineales bacterium]|nr:hypothetical protein [Anaerolineales bacterium]
MNQRYRDHLQHIRQSQQTAIRRQNIQAATKIQRAFRNRNPRYLIHTNYPQGETTFSRGIIRYSDSRLVLWSFERDEERNTELCDDYRFDRHTLAIQDANYKRLVLAFKSMRAGTHYMLRISTIRVAHPGILEEGDDMYMFAGAESSTFSRNNVTSNDRIVKKHGNLFNHNFSIRDQHNTQLMSYLVHIDVALLHALSYPLIQYEFIPLPNAVRGSSLLAMNDVDINCVMSIASVQYPKQRELCIQWGATLRDEGTEHISDMQQPANDLGHRYTFHDGDNDE